MGNMVSGANGQDHDGTPLSGPPELAPPREPAFNAPWPPLLICALIVGLYALQSLSGQSGSLAMTFGFTPRDLDDHHYETLITSLFVHGSWTHALFNAGFVLAFGAPVARLLGQAIKSIHEETSVSSLFV